MVKKSRTRKVKKRTLMCLFNRLSMKSISRMKGRRLTSHQGRIVHKILSMKILLL